MDSGMIPLKLLKLKYLFISFKIENVLLIS